MFDRPYDNNNPLAAAAKPAYKTYPAATNLNLIFKGKSRKPSQGFSTRKSSSLTPSTSSSPTPPCCGFVEL